MSTEPLTLAQMPESLVAGDSLSFRVDDARAVPADGWAVQFVLSGPSQQVVEGDVDPDDAAAFLVQIGSSVSAEWVPGVYAWVVLALNEDADARLTLATGQLAVTPDPLTQEGATEQRSFAAQKLAALETALLAKGDATSYSLFGRTYSFESHEALLKAREFLRREVAQEEEARRRALGRPSQATAWFHFGG